MTGQIDVEIIPIPFPNPPAPATIAFFGDSNTVGYPNACLEDGVSTGTSYVAQVGGTLTVDLTKSYAHNGYTTSQVKAAAVPIPGTTAVLMLGTNDLRTGIDLRTSMQEIERWWKNSTPDALLVMAIPPYTGKNALVAEYNAALKVLAAKWGWEYGDPWKPFRTADGSWLPGSNVDTKHAAPAVYTVIGCKVQAKLELMTA